MGDPLWGREPLLARAGPRLFCSLTCAVPVLRPAHPVGLKPDLIQEALPVGPHCNLPPWEHHLSFHPPHPELAHPRASLPRANLTVPVVRSLPTPQTDDLEGWANCLLYNFKALARPLFLVPHSNPTSGRGVQGREVMSQSCSWMKASLTSSIPGLIPNTELLPTGGTGRPSANRPQGQLSGLAPRGRTALAPAAPPPALRLPLFTPLLLPLRWLGFGPQQPHCSSQPF